MLLDRENSESFQMFIQTFRFHSSSQHTTYIAFPQSPLFTFRCVVAFSANILPYASSPYVCMCNVCSRYLIFCLLLCTTRRELRSQSDHQYSPCALSECTGKIDDPRAKSCIIIFRRVTSLSLGSC